MTPFIRTMQDLVTRTAFAMTVVGLTAAFAIAQQPVAPAPPAPPAKPAAAAQPTPPAGPAPAARPAPRPLPSRNVKLQVSLVPVSGTVAGAPRVLTVTTAEGRHAQVRRQTGGNDFFNLDTTPTIVNDRLVLVEFQLNGEASEGADVTPGKSARITQEGSVLLTPGLKQRVTQLDDSGGRPNLHVEMLVEIVK